MINNKWCSAICIGFFNIQPDRTFDNATRLVTTIHISVMAAGNRQLYVTINIGSLSTAINLLDNTIWLTAQHHIGTTCHFSILTATINFTKIQVTDSIIADFYIRATRDITLGITTTVGLMNGTTFQEYLGFAIDISTRIGEFCSAGTITTTKDSANLIGTFDLHTSIRNISSKSTAIDLVDTYITGFNEYLRCLTCSCITGLVTATINSSQIIGCIVFASRTHIRARSFSLINMHLNITFRRTFGVVTSEDATCDDASTIIFVQFHKDITLHSCGIVVIAKSATKHITINSTLEKIHRCRVTRAGIDSTHSTTAIHITIYSCTGIIGITNIHYHIAVNFCIRSKATAEYNIWSR